MLAATLQELFEKEQMIDKSDKLKSQIMLNIGENSFTLLHSDDLDLLEVYLVLSAALDYIEDEAEAISRREGSYLQ
jgi:hypothetical protein